MKIKQLLNEDVRSVLGDESLDAIETAFNDKVSLAVESALEQQDGLFAKKLEALMERVDTVYGEKLKKVLEAVDKDRTKKLVTLAKRYEIELNESAVSFRNEIRNDISDYLETVVLEDVLPQAQIQDAVRNTAAIDVLSNLRQVLAVDSTMMKESVQEAIIDGKSQIDSLTESNNKLKAQLATQKKQNGSLKKETFLSESTKDFDKTKTNYISKVFKDKSIDFVEENFEYVAKLFDKRERDTEKLLKNEAVKSRKTVVDSIPSEIIEEKTVNTNNDPEIDTYLQSMSRKKF